MRKREKQTLRAWRGSLLSILAISLNLRLRANKLTCVWVLFLRTETYRVEVWYSVVEDDLCVYLESVEIIHRPQQSFPGFDV